MKWCKYLIVLSVFSFGRLAIAQSADTLDIVGGNAGTWGFGWYGEAYKGTAWCGDTLYKDLTPDTIVVQDTNIRYSFITIVDTIRGVDTQYVARDSMVSDTTYSHHNVIKDSTLVDSCIQSDFVMDTGGPIPGAAYINYNYKFRNWYAQMPIVWNSWGGWDSATTVPYKYLMIVYKGLLPAHQASLSFFYSTWSYPVDSARHATDSIKNKTGAGDGVGILLPSPDEWKTVVIPIPDSVNLVRITGLTFSIGGGGQTSALGNLKVARISLLPDATGVRYAAVPRISSPAGKFSFIPKSAGKVTLSIYSLKGELLCNKTFGVEANRQYSVRQMVQRYSGLGSSQMKMVKIQGAGMNMNWKIR